MTPVEPGGPPVAGGPDGPEGPPGPDEGMGTTSVGFLAAWALAGLLLGRLLRPVSEWLGGAAPVITWPQPVALAAVAAALAAAARATHRAVHVDRRPLAPHQAVNRLLLARACALVGAVVAGGYLGYGLAWLGSASALADQRLIRSGVCVVAAVTVVIAALLLERACRVREPDAES